MRIAIFSDNFYPELSGISDSIITLARELASRGHMIDFFAPYYSYENHKRAKVSQEELDLGPLIKINRFFSFPFPAATGQARLVFPTGLRSFKMKKNIPDVIHSQLFFGVGLEALAAARFLKRPLIGTNHTAFSEFIRYSPFRGKWFTKASMNYVSWYYNNCAYVTAPSRSVFDEMEIYGFNKPHSVISNPIDIQMFNPHNLNEADREIKKFKLSETTIVYAGRLAPEKNVDVLIRALALIKKEIPGVKLALAGHGVSDGILKLLARELGVQDSIIFTGTLSKPLLAALYRASKIFVIASGSETQSMTMMQAMASGLPTVGARARGLLDYINQGNGLFAEARDEHDFAGKILQLLKNPAERRKLGKGAWEFSQKFSPKNIADRWEEIYQNALNIK